VSKTKTRQEEDTKSEEMMSVSLELGEKHWKIAVGSELGGEMKKMVADLSLDARMLKALNSKKS